MDTDAVITPVLGRSMQVDDNAMEDDDANGMMKNDLNDKIDCHM